MDDIQVRSVELSVVIPTHNNLNVLKRCIQSWDLVDDVNYELIVVEDGCSDSTAEWLSQVCDGERLRWVHENDVFEVLCDIRGIGEARGRYILIWQDDMFVTKQWLIHEIVATMNKWSEIGVLGLMRGNRYKPYHYKPVTHAQFYDICHRPYGMNGGLFYAHEVDACVRPWLVRKECIDRHGSLDPVFAPLHWDEIDFHFKIRAAGWKVAVLPYEILEAYRHLGSATTAKLDSVWHENTFVKNGRLFYDRWTENIRRNEKRKYKKWKRISDKKLLPGSRQYITWLLRRQVKQRLTVVHAKIVLKKLLSFFMKEKIKVAP